MELRKYKTLFHSLFYIGAMLACFGIGAILMGSKTLGIILLIVGASMIVISFSMIKFFIMLDWNRTLKNTNNKKQ